MTPQELATQLANLQDLTRQIPCVMWLTDTEMRIIDGFGSRLGPAFDFDAFRGKTVCEIFGDSEVGPAPIAGHLAALTGQTSRFDIYYGGRSLGVTIEPSFDASGAIVGCIGHAVDVSDRVAAEEALRASEQRFELVARALNDVIWDWDIATGSVWWSEGVRSRFGHEATGRVTSIQWFKDQIHPEDRSRVTQSLLEAVEGDAQSWSTEYRFVRADGSFAHVFDRGMILRDDDGSAIRMAGGLQDITERKLLESDLFHYSFEDELSGLPNRALFLDRLRHALDERKTSRTPLTLIFLDLDAFKSVNDSLGHPTGDMLLSDLANRMRAILPPETLIARLGGDEFAVLVENVEMTSDIVDLASRLLKTIREPFLVESRSLNITASLGIASIGPSAGDITATEVLRRADAAMYRAKEQGKDRFAFYEPSLDHHAFTQLEVELGLRNAIERGQLVLQYQPEIDLANGRIEGMEALVRWQHPDLGLLPPAYFIPIAEKTDLILALDDWVFREVCRQTAAWKPLLACRPGFTIGIHVSARQFARPGLPKRIQATLHEYDVSPENILLEITETATTLDIEAAVGQMGALKELGVRLAIDDFGTGFASLTYLRHFPIDMLKIDRTFISDVLVNPATRTIVQGVTTLAQLLKLGVIAEGIETVEQLREVVDLGCHRGQGFYFGQPVDADAATALLEHGLPGISSITPLRLRAAA